MPNQPKLSFWRDVFSTIKIKTYSRKIDLNDFAFEVLSLINLLKTDVFDSIGLIGKWLNGLVNVYVDRAFMDILKKLNCVIGQNLHFLLAALLLVYFSPDWYGHIAFRAGVISIEHYEHVDQVLSERGVLRVEW